MSREQTKKRFQQISTKDMYEIPSMFITEYNSRSTFMRFDVQSLLFGFKKKYGKGTTLRFFFMGSKTEFDNSCGSLVNAMQQVHPDIKTLEYDVVGRSNGDLPLAERKAMELYKYGSSELQGGGHNPDNLFRPPTKKGLPLCKATYNLMHEHGENATVFHPYDNFAKDGVGYEYIKDKQHGMPMDSEFCMQFKNLKDVHAPLFLVYDKNIGLIMQDLFRIGNLKNPEFESALNTIRDYAMGKCSFADIKLNAFKHLQGVNHKDTWLGDEQSVNFLVTSSDCMPIAVLRVAHDDNYSSERREGRRPSEEGTLTDYSLYTSNISSACEMRNTRDVANYANNFSTFYKKVRTRELETPEDFVRQFINATSANQFNAIHKKLSTEHIFEPTEEDRKSGSAYARKWKDKKDIYIKPLDEDRSNLSLGSDQTKDSKFVVLRLLIDNLTSEMKAKINPDSLKIATDFIKEKSFTSRFNQNTVDLKYSTSEILQTLFGKDLIEYMFNDAIPNYIDANRRNKEVNQAFNNFIGILPLGKNGCYGFMYLESYQISAIHMDVIAQLKRVKANMGSNFERIDDNQLRTSLLKANCFNIDTSNFRSVDFDAEFAKKFDYKWLYKPNYRDYSKEGTESRYQLYMMRHLKSIKDFDKDIFSEQFKSLTFARMKGEFDRDGFVAYKLDRDGKKEYRGGYWRESMRNYIPKSNMVLFHQFYNYVYSNDWIISPIANLEKRFGKRDELGLHWISGLKVTGDTEEEVE